MFLEDYQNRIEFRFLNRDFLKDIRKAAMNTVGRKNFSGKTMSPEMFRRYLVSEHSPIRTAILETLFIEVYSPTSVHFARHVHSTPFVQTSREDRTGKERSLETPVDHLAVWNLQALIEMMRKRLCKGCCAEDTYNWARSLKCKLMNSEDQYIRILGEVLVPNCIYRCGCPEFKPCNMHIAALKNCDKDSLMNINSRSDSYNRWLKQSCS